MLMRYSIKIPSIFDRNFQKKAQLSFLKKIRSVSNSVVWTRQEKNEFNSFWFPYSGHHKIISQHHKYFQSITGVFNPAFISNYLFYTKIEPFFNPYYLSEYFQNKSMAQYLFNGIENLLIPKVFFEISREGCFIFNDTMVAKKYAVNACNNIGTVLIKPSLSTARGVGIKICNIVNGIDTITNKSLSSILDEYNNRDLIVQQWVESSDEMHKLYPFSIGTFRVTTYILNGNIHCGPIALRQSIGKAKIDGMNSKGYIIGVNRDSGTLYEHGYFYDDLNPYSLYEHPDTKIPFKDYYVGDVEKMISVAKHLHTRIPDLGIASWDLAFGKNGNIVLIELNLHYQGIDINQIATATPIFENHTKELLDIVFKQ